MSNILIIDDDKNILSLMAKACQLRHHEVVAVASGREGLASLDSSPPDLAIIDLKLTDMDGLDIIKHCAERHPQVKMIMITGHASVVTAVEAMRHGAFDYLTKPFEMADLLRTIDLALQTSARGLPTALPTGFSEAFTSAPVKLIGESPKTQEILQIIKKVADLDSPVLLEGEFGTGKQMVARSLHQASRRRDAPFKTLQCSALPEDLLEMELFGSPGGNGSNLFSRAAGGTVLLEEIHLLPLRLQAQLESRLEEVNARRSAGTLAPNMDVRLIVSTVKPLHQEVEEGAFRQDLFYKISVIPVSVPPLRSRREDILPLSQHFLARYAERVGGKAPEIDKYAQKLLLGYSWPGNVGELQNALEQACAFAEDHRIRPADLPPKVSQKVEVTDEDQKTTHHLPIGAPLSDYLRKQEKLFIDETLKYNGMSREKTASMLGVSIATLYRKMGVKLEKGRERSKA
jgi:DNA-binding NtrC family response regulator